MSEETNQKQGLNGLFEQINQHLETRWASFSLSATEKLSDVAANMAGVFTLLIFALLLLLFFCLGLAWWLGDFIGSRAGGFALGGLIFIPVGMLAYRWIGPFVRNKIIQSALKEDDTKPSN